MRLTLRLLVALTLAALVILGANGYFRVRRELAFFEDDMRRDARLAGRILARAVRDAWRVGGEDAGLAIVRDASLSRQHIEVRWTWLDDASLRDELDPALLARARDGEIIAQHAISGEGEHLITLVPVMVPGGQLGAIELSEPLADEANYIRDSIRDSVVATFLLIGTMAAASLAIGVVFIGRPTRALVAKARRAAEGDLGGPLRLPQRDELGQLARELDAMCERLAESRDRAAAETDARIRAVEQLRHADRLTTVGMLASGVAHELGTPLNVVGGRAQMIEGGEVTGDELRDSARIIREQTARMTTIVRQLLDFARRRPPRCEQVALRPIVARVLALVETIARKRRVELNLTGDDATAWVDEDQLEQALLNIVVNALQATPPGGTVEVGVGAATPWASVRIADTGAGMDEATLARVFEPFFTTKGVGEGTGLGLAVTYGIVREAGGRIDVESRPGAGSAFTVHVPAKRPEVPA